MDQDKIGKLIESIRKEHHLTQKELADHLGVTHQAVSKWENGRNIPDIGILKQLAEDYDLNLEEILNGEKKKRKTPIYIKWIPILFVVVGIIIVSLLKPKDFEFKTISSKCSDFELSGSAAYNKEKTSIYISNIEFCGKENKTIYQEMNCYFYEKKEGEKELISTCPKKENTTLEDYLKEVRIEIEDSKNLCKDLTKTTLMIEIAAKTKENKIETFLIPIKLNDSCK